MNGKKAKLLRKMAEDYYYNETKDFSKTQRGIYQKLKKLFNQGLFI